MTENIESLKKLTPECDRLDYALAACSGAICGILDIFLVGIPKDSSFGKMSDKWFADCTMTFAKMYGWNGEGGLPSAIKTLEKVFIIPYDQTGMKEAGLQYLDLDMKNHHFKSLAHSPSLLGLFFSVLDQFGDAEGNIAHFVTNGELAIWKVPEGTFELRGKTVPAKLFSAFVNWFGHLISDMSGSSSSKIRGMGIPSPLWTWTNDIIAIKKSLGIKTSDFDKNVNDLALQIYLKGYDARFQTAQAIPVFINEMVVRLLYSLRRMVYYYSITNPSERSFSDCWNTCEPFSNATVKRMLTVAHGTFCLIDTGDALIRSTVKGAGSVNVEEFFMRLNIVGIGRFTISLCGEVYRSYSKFNINNDIFFLNREKTIVLDYIDGLEKISHIYDDCELVKFVDEFKDSNCYKEAFSKSVKLARLRNVPESNILKNKADIDSYFMGNKGTWQKKNQN